VCSHDSGTLNTATFDNVSVTAASGTGPRDIVVRAADLPASARHGIWGTASDTTAAGGTKLTTSDTGWSSLDTPLASPANYVDVPFNADAGTPYRVWLRLKARGNSAAKLGDHGQWSNLGPDNAVYPLNPFRNRYVYVPNEYVAAGRTAHAVIDPNCSATKCRYWIANAGGGIWRTENAFAAQPEWEFLSPGFEHNNTAALELDPNDSSSETLYAGTGEPNTCRSGCIAGVGMYSSKDGGDHWKGPIGAQYFSGRGIGAIEVKPGSSSTIFVATGAHGSRGISSTCCKRSGSASTVASMSVPTAVNWTSADCASGAVRRTTSEATSPKPIGAVINSSSPVSERASVNRSAARRSMRAISARVSSNSSPLASSGSLRR